jgi:TMEM175 potassium channel family protein
MADRATSPIPGPGTAGKHDPGPSPERLIFFSDAVLAIALTLLALDLPLPDGSSSHRFFSSVQADGSEYAAFLVSFLVVAFAWRNHHRALGAIQRIDSRLVTFNFVWLFTVVLVPFAARLLALGRHNDLIVHACCFGFYSLIQAVSNAALLALLRHAETRGLNPPGEPGRVAGLAWKCGGIVIGFGLAIPVFFLTEYAWVLWIAGPVAVAGLRRGARVPLRSA